LPPIVRQQRWQRRNRPLCIQKQDQVLLLHHLLELGKADAFGRWQLSADLLERGKSALVNFALRKAHIDQRAHCRFEQAALIDTLLEVCRGLLCDCLSC
jgi:hypothetical protein